MPRFCTAPYEGGRCSTRALPSQAFCAGHHPTWALPPDCRYFNRRGQQCRALALRGQDHCFTHSPRNRRVRRPAIPLVPRTRRQKAQARWFVLSILPQCSTSHPQPIAIQNFAVVPS